MKNSKMMKHFLIRPLSVLIAGSFISIDRASATHPELLDNHSPRFDSAQMPSLKKIRTPLFETEKFLTKLKSETLPAPPSRKIHLLMPSFPRLHGPPPLKMNLSSASEPPELKKVSVLSDVELKIIEALIFHEVREEHELGIGILADVLQKRPTPEVLYNYARMALALGLQIEYRNKMLEALTQSKSTPEKDSALGHLIQNANSLEVEDVGLIDPHIKASEDSLKLSPDFFLLRGKFYNRKGELSRAKESLARVAENSSSYLESLFLQGIIEYKSGNLEGAIAQLEKIMALSERDPKNNLYSLVAITLGRLYFQKADFRKSFELFRRVDRGHALWFEAMAEQAWAQIMIKDFEGAAGNMYSLHTDYFKNVYAPETFLIRSVGYLNLCQYGDGMRVLVDLGKKYFPIKEKLDRFVIQNKTNSSLLYEKLKLWSKNPDLREIDGVPTPFLVKAGRDPEFMSLQKKINQREDEIQHFNKMFLNLMEGERQALKNENQFIKNLYRQARASLKHVRSNTINSLHEEIERLKNKASLALHRRFEKLRVQLQSTIENHEILYYEVYSGAGEHLRYQTAGGKPNQAPRPQLTGEKGKNLVWKFKGEIWEDEIGHYRSSLKSVCPEESQESNAVVADGL